MIERFFVKGATFTWAAPNPVTGSTDGTIVQSGNAAPPGMTFTGWDHEIPYSPQAPTLGLRANTVIPYYWLDYVHFRTAYVEPAASDVLTGFMSGCWICSWTEPGALLQRRVGHVGTVETVKKNEVPNTTVKAGFLNDVGVNGLGLTGYNPAQDAVWTFNEILALVNKSKQPGNLEAKIMSLVTSTDDFYSIVMILRRDKNTWVCGGKKRVLPSDRAAITLALQ
jgi:hypothetical protein